MKDKIKHFSKGDFQIKKPNVIFPETNLILKIGEGELYKGSFVIENQADGDIRGLVYPSSFRMQCREPGFQGSPVIIHFEYDGRGLKPGHVEQGVFTVVCNGGEFEIGFTAIIEKPFVMTSQGKIQNLRGFKKLAYTDFEEAKKIFKSREFYELIKYEPVKMKNLYDNMRKWNLDAMGMEEFLVGIKQKEMIYLSLDLKERSYKDIEGVCKDSIRIKKNTWGFLSFKIYTDCEFVELDLSHASTNDFQGMYLDVPYTILSTKLHGGKNLGNIIIETPFTKLYYNIEVDNSKLENKNHRREEYIYAYLMKNYIRYESGMLGKYDWIQKSMQQIQQLQGMDSDNQFYKLLQAHLYLLEEEFDEAKWILESYNYNKFAVGRNSELDAYYIYLMTLQKRDYNYTKKVIDDLQKYYLKNPKSYKILCMLIQVDPYYNDYYERKNALENQFNLGTCSTLVYIETYKCFRDKCTNLKRLGNFEIQILNFAVKYKLMTEELALYTANLATQQKVFDHRVFQILEESYRMFPDVMILTAICTILIKGNLVGERYFKWYALGVNEDIKLAKLFEYYMDSINPIQKKPLPRTVLLYFAHGNNLNYEKNALLYANIITYEREGSELYQCYAEAMKIFTMQQLELRRINENLKKLYKTFVSDNEMNTEKIKAIYDITHSYLVTTKVKNIKYVLVIAEDGGVYQKIPYTEYGAKVVLDSPDDILAWEANDGAIYIGSIKYQTERLFHEKKYIDMCKKRLDVMNLNAEEQEEVPLTFEALYEKGVDYFEEHKVLAMCTKMLKDNFKEDDYLTYILFTLFKREHYDKSTLQYLSAFYCGTTRNMKEIWQAARDYEVNVHKLSERIISQMLFSEVIFGEEEIFEDYYKNGGYFRLEEAYIAYISREYLVKNKLISAQLIHIIMTELFNQRNMTDVVKIACLKYFSTHEYNKDEIIVLKRCMQELCEKQIYFDFYQYYGEEWLREVQLWDKTLITYTAQMGGKVKLIYQLLPKNKESVEYESEVLLPVFESIYVKKFLVFEDEILRYYFKETLGDSVIKSEKFIHEVKPTQSYHGKYGRLNEIVNKVEQREQLMTNYALEETLANKMFVPYE